MWILVMVSLADNNLIAEKISIHTSIAECYVAKTEQEFEYNFDTLNRDWVCIRTSGNWDYLLRY